MIKNISQVKNISDLTSYIRFLFAKSLFDMLKIDPSNEPNEEIADIIPTRRLADLLLLV